ncbi:hypothetical protein [Paenibacillus crassostreae]|nr:hypothetical protein [Paenibacillus crassostreae]
MRNDKSLKSNSNVQRNKASLKQESTSLSPDKSKEYPASLNGISKTES